MATTVTELLSGGTVDTAAPWETATISSATDGHVVVVDVSSFVGGGTAPGDGGTGLTGCGQTWTSLGTVTGTDGATGSWRYQRFACVVSSWSSGVLTASFTTTAPSEVFFRAVSLDEMPGTIGAADVQTATASGSSAAPSVTLSSFADATNNVCLLGVGAYQGGGAISAGTGMTEVGAELTGGANGNQHFLARQTGENTSPDATMTSTDWLAIATEFDNDGGGGGSAALLFTNNMMLSGR